MMDLKLFVVTSIGVLGVSNRSMICITFRSVIFACLTWLVTKIAMSKRIIFFL